MLGEEMTAAVHLYADTVLSLSEKCLLELLELKKACSKRDLNFFNSSLISLSKKKEVLERIGFSKETLGFLYQLTLKKRWSCFNSICDECLKIIDQRKGILKGVVWTNQDITSEELKKITQAVERKFKDKIIQLQVQKRKTLIGGLRIEIGGFSFDDSILYHLNQFKEQVRNYGGS